MKSKSVTATLLLIFVTAAWGLTFTLIKDAIQELSPLSFVAIRFLMASILLGAYIKLATPKKTSKSSLKEWRAGASLGLFLFFGYAFQTFGLKFTTASNAGFITGMSVVLVPLISLYTDSAPVKWNSWAGVALSFIGLTLLSLSGRLGINGGDALVLLCSIAFAFHIVFVGKYAATYDPARLTWMQITTCGILSLVASFIFEQRSLASLPLALAQVKVFGALCFCALVATAAAYLIQNAFQCYSTPVRTALIFTCEPVFSAIFAYFFAGELLHAQQLLGCALVLFGMLLAELGDPAWLVIRSKLNFKPSQMSKLSSGK